MRLQDRIHRLRELAAAPPEDGASPSILTCREADRLTGRRQNLTALLEKRRNSAILTSTAKLYARTFGCTLDWLIAGRGPEPTEEDVRAAVERAKTRADARARRKGRNGEQGRHIGRAATGEQGGSASRRSPSRVVKIGAHTKCECTHTNGKHYKRVTRRGVVAYDKCALCRCPHFRPHFATRRADQGRPARKAA